MSPANRAANNAAKKAASKSTRALPAARADSLLTALKARFDAHPERHKGIGWAEVDKRLRASADKLAVLHRMEETGGEPDVIGQDKKTGELLFCDCALESPKGRRSICFDKAAHASRKENKPSGSAEAMAEEIGIEMLDEEQYRALQRVGTFDAKTSSWIKTPDAIRKLGGALFGDYRYGTVFIYHNGAESYYAARGFRGLLRV